MFSHITPTQARYFAGVLRMEWRLAEATTSEATRGLVLSDKVAFTRVELKSEAVHEAVRKTRGVIGRIIAAFPTDASDSEDMSLHRLEFYAADGTALRAPIAMNLLDESVSGVVHNELTDFIMTSRGL
jgi:hypothetical protein